MQLTDSDSAEITNLSRNAGIVVGMRRFAIPILAFSSFLLTVLPLSAHAILMSATPGLSQLVRGPDVPVTLRFNSRIDAARSTIELVAASGETRKLVINKPSTPDSLDTEAWGLASGSYILRWQVLATDGHITRGEVPFKVR